MPNPSLPTPGSPSQRSPLPGSSPLPAPGGLDFTAFQNPAVRANVAPQIRAQQAQKDDEERRRQEQERELARQQKEQQRQQEKQQKANEAAARRAANNAAEARYTAEGRPTYTDADGIIRPKVDDATWQKQKQTEAANAKATETFTREGRKHWKNPVTGMVEPLQSDAELEAQKAAAAEKNRRSLLDKEVTSLETVAADPARKTLTDTARKNLEKALKKSQMEAAVALTGNLSATAQKKDTGAWWNPLDTTTPPEAVAAQERITRLSQPDATLTEADLADLEANDATKPTAAKIRNLMAALAKDDEAKAFHEEHARKIWEAKLRRDNPAEWERQQAERFAADPAAASAELQQKAAAHTEKRAAVQAQIDTFQQRLADLEAQNAEAVKRGLAADEIDRKSVV